MRLQNYMANPALSYVRVDLKYLHGDQLSYS